MTDQSNQYRLAGEWLYQPHQNAPTPKKNVDQYPTRQFMNGVIGMTYVS